MILIDLDTFNFLTEIFSLLGNIPLESFFLFGAFGKSKNKSKPSPIDKTRADVLTKYTDFYGPHLQTPDQLIQASGPSLSASLNAGRDGRPQGNSQAPQGNFQAPHPGIFGAGARRGPSAADSIRAGEIGSRAQMPAGVSGNGYQTSAQQQQQQNQGNPKGPPKQNQGNPKGQGSTTPSAPNPASSGLANAVGSGLAGGSPTQTQGQAPVGAPQAQGPQSNVLLDAFNRASAPVTAYGGTEFQNTAQRPDAPELQNFFDDYSGPKNFYEGYEDPTTFFNEEGKTGRGTFDKVLGRLTAGDSYDTDFGKFFDDYGGEGKPQGLGGYARHAEDVFGERINRRASERFGREGSGLGASGLLNSSALSNLERGISDDRDQTQAEYGVGVLGNALNTYGQHEGARANRQLGADQGLLNLGYGDFARDIGSRQSDFDTGLNRQVGAHQANQGNVLQRYGQEGQQYLGERESDLGRYRTELDSGRQSHEFAQGANQQGSQQMFKFLADAEERERERKLRLLQLPNRAFETGLGTTPGAPLTNSSSVSIGG